MSAQASSLSFSIVTALEGASVSIVSLLPAVH